MISYCKTNLIKKSKAHKINNITIPKIINITAPKIKHTKIFNSKITNDANSAEIKRKTPPLSKKQV